MKLRLVRYAHGKDSTGGLLFDDDGFLCFTCEDEFREVKVPGETRIPPGVYKIKLRDEGGMTQKYRAKFGDLHQGMLHLQDVPGFTYIYIHIGNTEAHTEGCILVGLGAYRTGTEMQTTHSTEAYLLLYRKVLAALDAGEEVEITVQD